MSMRRWLLIISRASTYFPISSAPSSAFRIFLVPSKRNGMVTMPTVSTPRSCASLATTGAAPVPVPPPIPAVTKTILVSSSKRLRMSSQLSSAACLPISGLLPAPRPLVVLGPMSKRLGTGDMLSACRSVLMEMNSTPWVPDFTILLTTLLPAPPTPTTLIATTLSGPFSALTSMFVPPILVSSCGMIVSTGMTGSIGSTGTESTTGSAASACSAVSTGTVAFSGTAGCTGSEGRTDSAWCP